MNTYIVNVYRKGNVADVIEELKFGGARWWKMIPAPFYNIWGEQVSTQYIIVYMADNEIPCEIQN